MPLPKLKAPTYTLTLPSVDKKVKYRPFVVKDEQVLLTAMESGDEEHMLNAIRDVVQSCTFDKIDVDNLPQFDLEYVFLRIRAKSVGETSTINVLCPDDEKTYVPVTLNLEEIECHVDDAHDNNIKLTDSVGIILGYPNYETIKSLAGKTLNSELVLDIVKKSIVQVYDGDTVYELSDFTEKELDEFLSGFTTEALKKIKTFFDTMPRLRHEIEVENPDTKVKSKVVLEGLRSFF